ncbi:putative leucine-rich repeat-containing protein DDB_G0290503 [Rhopalosiphum padi]|uniref:putative leucine-rich repeat-containing protein DDB_G0290503 n=1 Tax=Rhopalosiphum padi TaxID=40932 RepID=UPI00298EB801|nr:putative leucine-rich repeat-containing protein DDB_G0290503 [Rhopalosiphum padi]
MVHGNAKTKKKIYQSRISINHWKTKFKCLSHQIRTLVNSTKSDKNTKLLNIQDKNVKDTTLCSNIGVDKQANDIDIKKKVSTELKSDITPDNLKTYNYKPHTIERCMNKSIDYEDDIIIISDNEDNDSNFNFCEVDNEEVNNEINEINKIDLKDYESMIFTDLKKNWPTILKKMSDPLTGNKVFESILLNKLLFRMVHGNAKTKKKIYQSRISINHWKTKFKCLSHQIRTLVNSTKSDKNTKLLNIQDKNVKDTTLCSNIGVDKQANDIDIKKKVSTELKSDITPDNLKTSKLCQQSLKSKNKYLSESDSDIMTSKSEEIKTNKSSTPVKADLIKDIPTDLTITEQNNLTQSYSDIKINQSKDNESNELFTPVSDVTTALELSPKSLKRKICYLIQNNTSIEITKPKFVNK